MDSTRGFPKTLQGLVDAGYIDTGNVTVCKGEHCTDELRWFITPKGKKIPLNNATLEPHWGECPDAQSFRKKR